MRGPSTSPWISPASFRTLRCWETVDWASPTSSTISPQTQVSRPRQQSHDPHPRRVAERLGQLGELGVGLGALDGPQVGGGDRWAAGRVSSYKYD